MTAYCPDCLVIEVSPTARDGRCNRCRPSRRHSVPVPKKLDRIDTALLAGSSEDSHR